MANPERGNGEVVVCFSTVLPERYKVPEDQLVVPESLARYGLSEVVNHLLDFDPPVPFDFLVDGEFLRSTVKEHLDFHKLSSEKVLKLEYVLALSEPEPKDIDEVPDWISGISSVGDHFVAVSYDGTARLYEDSRSKLIVRMSDSPLTGVASVRVEGGSHVAAAGKDGTVRCCALSHGGAAPRAGPVVSLFAPDAKAMEAVAFSEDATLLAGGGWSQDVCVWNADVFSSPAASGKRAAPDSAAGPLPKFVLKGHNQVVTSLRFGDRARFPYTLVSGSWDCSLRVWDIAAASCVCHWPVGRAVTSMSFSPAATPQIATSHEDGHVSLWDVRAPPHPTVQGALFLDATAGLPLAVAMAPHRRQAAQVAWCPDDANRIASVGHDGFLCILDPRSPKMPLQTVKVGKPYPCPTRLLCLSWLSAEAIALGGSDGNVVRVDIGSKPGI